MKRQPAKAASGTAKVSRKGPARTEPVAEQESVSQFTLKLRASLHRELTVLAFNSGMTMRGFVMNALKQQGLNVEDDDLVDRRKR
ncbi:MAG: hypothetical protein ACR2PZ_17390 [Pseudomonadales bacterium]